MRTFVHKLAGEEMTFNVPESPRDLHGFWDFLALGDKIIGLDTETTGLNTYAAGFECRLVQFGNRDTAWVLRADLFRDAIAKALRQKRHFVVHNAAFDLKVIDRTIGVPLEELGPRTFDTRILAHLLDPRQHHEGGAGLALKELSEVYIDPMASDGQKELQEVFRRDYKATKATGWALIDVNDETYLRYAGQDPVLARRLFDELAPMVRGLGLDHLAQFEHHLMVLTCCMERRGMRIDVPYTERLGAELAAEGEEFRKVAAKYGVENINSTAQVAAALTAMGEDLTETTAGGAPKVDKGVLTGLADLNLQWEPVGVRTPNPLADAVLRAKRAEKWNESYVKAFLDLRDENDRVHPFIGTLQARTARMSVSNPPLQQLPSKEWRVRRAIIADPGQVIVSADYAAVEMRVLAALADVTAMKTAINNGDDLHSFTARLVYGDDFTKAQRGLMKGVGFGKVYGGGAATLSRQTGAPLESVKSAIAEYDRVYPEVKRFGKRLQARAEYGKKEVVTPSGRHLPLDRDRLYAATNYMCQSTSRDVTAQAIVDLFDAGMGDHLLLPVHDEIIAQAPAGEAEEFAAELAKVMTQTFQGVVLEAEGEVYGPSWGAGYGAPADA